MQLSDIHWTDLLVKIVSAIVILIVTAVLARIAKRVLTTQFGKIKALNRTDDGGESLAATLGTVVSLVIWLFGLVAILNLFELTLVLTPIQDLLVGLLAALPKIIGAALVLFIGFILAKVVRELVVAALVAANVDRLASRLGGAASSATRGGQLGRHTASATAADAGATAASEPDAPSRPPVQISRMIGQLLFAVILLVVGIAALQVLGIQAISDPATHMLSLILDAIPLVIAAAILLAIGVMIARFVAGLIESLLRPLDIDGALSRLGVDTSRTDLVGVISWVVQIAIILFFAVAASNILNFPQVTAILSTVLDIAGRVVFGAVVIAAGVFIAGVLARMLGGQAATIVRYATIVLFVAIGLKFMGLADSIVNLAFGALVVGGAAAAALAYGLGGREAAARQLNAAQSRLGTVTPASSRGPESETTTHPSARPPEKDPLG